MDFHRRVSGNTGGIMRLWVVRSFVYTLALFQRRHSDGRTDFVRSTTWCQQHTLYHSHFCHPDLVFCYHIVSVGLCLQHHPPTACFSSSGSCDSLYGYGILMAGFGLLKWVRVRFGGYHTYYYITIQNYNNQEKMDPKTKIYMVLYHSTYDVI